MEHDLVVDLGRRRRRLSAVGGPDVILRPRADFSLTSHPGAADVPPGVEVADTSLACDLGRKVPLDARHGIPEVWVIDPATRQIRVFRSPCGSGYAEEAGVEPHEAVACTGVIDDVGDRGAVELPRLLSPSA